MARIKKKGLDYFPLNTDFIHDRAVRRLMKREGDSALGILVEILSYIYAGEGYYVRADRLFYEDLSAGLYEKSADDVERIVRLAVEYVFQTQAVPTLQFYRTPDARCNQPRAPVPAVMIARLPGERAELFPGKSPVVRLIVPSLVTVGEGFVLRQGLFDRGVEIDAQHVATLLE